MSVKLVSIPDVLNLASIDIPSLNEGSNAEITQATSRVNDLILSASDEVTAAIGYCPIQDTDETRHWRKLGTSYNIISCEAFRTITSMQRLTDDDTYVDIPYLPIGSPVSVSTYNRHIESKQLIGDSTRIKTVGRFGLVDSLSEFDGHPLQRVTAAKVYALLFKEGLIVNTTQGSNTSRFNAETSWMSDEHLEEIMSRYRISANNVINV